MAKSLIEKIAELETKIYISSLKDHEKINNLGWGYSMRCVKLPKFTRTDNLKEKLKVLKNQS